VSLTSIPLDLFKFNIVVSDYIGTFQSCRNLAVPATLFDTTKLGIVSGFDYFLFVDTAVYSATGTMQDIWTYATSATSAQAFRNNTSLTNYASIPVGWK
jgi:hypothetical protein